MLKNLSKMLSESFTYYALHLPYYAPICSTFPIDQSMYKPYKCPTKVFQYVATVLIKVIVIYDCSIRVFMLHLSVLLESIVNMLA